MPRTIEITMKAGGFEVTTGGITSSFRRLEDAVAFAQERFERAQAIRDTLANLD